MSDDHGLYQWHYGVSLFCEMKGRFVLFVSSKVFNNNLMDVRVLVVIMKDSHRK